MDFYQILFIILSFLIGCLFALAELLSRYKDIKQILKNLSSVLYLLINGISSIIAFFILKMFGISENNDIIRVIFAGASSMIILRSSFANIRVGDKDFKTGIAEVIQIYLEYAEITFDLKRSQEDAEKINEIMSDVDFEKAKTALPYTCFNLMKKISVEEKKMVEDAIIELNKSSHPKKIKAFNLGISLSKVTRIEFLKSAVETLGDTIKEDFDQIDEKDWQ